MGGRNWRVFTAINATIALITVAAVVFDLTRGRTRTARSSGSGQQATSSSASVTNQPEDRIEKVHIESVEDLTRARVDDLGAVPAAELSDLMHRATPEQLAALALKFNDAPTDARTFGGMGVFFQTWAELDPKAAITGAFRINDVGMRELAARTVVHSISPSATPDLITFLSDHPDKELENKCANEFLATLITNWSLLDPEAASNYMNQLYDRRSEISYELSSAKTDVAYNWATLDPSGAMEWADKMESGSEYANELHRNTVRGWCRKDLNAASAYVAQHVGDPKIADTAPTVVNAMFDRNRDETISWVTELPTGSARENAESRLVSLWAARDPSAAANWVSTLPENEKANVAATIMNNWANKDWPAASQWLSTLMGDAHDEAVAAAVNREQSTPEESLSLAMSIAKDQARNEVIENVVRNWATSDAKAAEEWVSRSSLPDEKRDQLKSMISEIEKNAAESSEATQAEVERVITH